MDKNYQKYFDLFHKERILYNTGKDKFKNCKGCDKDKNLIEKDNKLLFNCGSKSGVCGDQFEIILPEYKHYNLEKERLNKSIHGSFKYNKDTNDLSEYDLETLNKYMKVTDELNKQNEIIDKSEQNKKEIEKEFNKLNNITLRKESLQEYYNIKNKEFVEKNKILNKLKKETTTDEKKRELRKEYSRMTFENSKKIYELFKNIKKDFIYEIKTKDEVINVFNDDMDYEYESEEEREDLPDRNKTLKAQWGILSIMYEINELNSVPLQRLYDNIPKLRKITGLFEGSEPKNNIRDRLIHMRDDDGYVDHPDKGTYRITEKGKEYLDTMNQKFDNNSKENTKDKKSLKKMEKDKKDKKTVKKNKEKEDLQVKDSSKEEIKYFSRSKENKWLSAFNKGKPFEYEGYTYPTVEHAFHAQKIDSKDPKLKEYKEKLADQDLSPNEAKKLGGKKSFSENKYKFRKDWDKVKLKVMTEITEEYYKKNPKYLKKLIKTGNKILLHSGPRIDTFWGINSKEGSNHHGIILMNIRSKYSKDKKLTKEGEKYLNAAIEDMKERTKED